MSTQHPDNVTTPFFSDSEILAGPSEVKEAYFVFSQLGCTEQMWDSEGKEVDNQVVEKLYSQHLGFFRKKPLGDELRLTYRVPNPSVEREQGKILLEALSSIPRAYDVAKAAGMDIAPIFEVIQPMTTSAAELERVRAYYEQVIIGQRDTKLSPEGISVRDWVGDFGPERINVIPLFEDQSSITTSSEIVERYLEGKMLDYQRVFIARSDPALNYGSVSAVLMNKVALMRLHSLEERSGVPILPILGVGGSPFRGNFTPENVNNCTDEYPSVQTFTMQSSFKYDYAFRDVVNAVDMVNHLHRRPPLQIDEERAFALIEKITEEYQKQLKAVAQTINDIAPFIPGRRARKLHVGLFGYSRSMKGIKLPRAIKFCASFYSLGIPVSFMGLSALTEKEFDELHGLYVKLDEDLKDEARFLNMNNLDRMPPALLDGVKKVLGWVAYEEDDEYCSITSRIHSEFVSGKHTSLMEGIKAAAWKRRFLG